MVGIKEYMKRELKEIVIDSKDKVKGFYILLTKAKDSFVCLPDSAYIVPSSVLSELIKENINFEIIK